MLVGLELFGVCILFYYIPLDPMIFFFRVFGLMCLGYEYTQTLSLIDAYGQIHKGKFFSNY